MDLKWQDTEDIAIRLVEEHPETDPLTVRFTDMHAWIRRSQTPRTIPRNRTRKSSKRSRWPGMKNIRTRSLDFLNFPPRSSAEVIDRSTSLSSVSYCIASAIKREPM